jgi:hypothetical protein
MKAKDFFRMAEGYNDDTAKFDDAIEAEDTAHANNLVRAVRLLKGTKAEVASAVKDIFASLADGRQTFGADEVLLTMVGRRAFNRLFEAYRNNWSFETEVGALSPEEMAAEYICRPAPPKRVYGFTMAEAMEVLDISAADSEHYILRSLYSDGPEIENTNLNLDCQSLARALSRARVAEGPTDRALERGRELGHTHASYHAPGVGQRVVPIEDCPQDTDIRFLKTGFPFYANYNLHRYDPKIVDVTSTPVNDGHLSGLVSFAAQP